MPAVHWQRLGQRSAERQKRRVRFWSAPFGWSCPACDVYARRVELHNVGPKNVSEWTRANFKSKIGMLNLASATQADWLQRVERDIDVVLIDHAHCEKKAAGTAMNLIFAYVEQTELVRALEPIVVEELEHFRMVLDLLDQRGIRFRRLKPGPYGRKLHDAIRKQEPARAVDRLLVAALIEARSCERFSLLRDHLSDRELARFYGDLFECEARHHTTYVRLAERFATADQIRVRLSELARYEAEVIARCDWPTRMHS